MPLFCGCKQSCKNILQVSWNWVEKRTDLKRREEDSGFCLSVNRLYARRLVSVSVQSAAVDRQTDGECWEGKRGERKRESELMTSSYASVLVLMSFQGERKSTSPRMWRSGRLSPAELSASSLSGNPRPPAANERETETERETGQRGFLSTCQPVSLSLTVGGRPHLPFLIIYIESISSSASFTLAFIWRGITHVPWEK